MRHRKKGKILGRERAPRLALMRSLAQGLILYEKIQTTEAKAKALRPMVERLITKSKNSTLHNRRQLLSALPSENAVRKLLEIIGPRYKERPGGYTRIFHLMPRKNDAAKMAQIELVK